MSDRIPSRLNRHIVLSAVVSVTVGFGVGIAAHALWHRIRSHSQLPPDVVKELSVLKSEITELKHLLSSHRSALNDSPDELASMYPSDDDDEYFDVDRDQFRTQLPITPLPLEIMDELDHLAAIAMGDTTVLASSTPKIGAGGDELRLGSQAYARCLVYRKAYRRSPEFLWRFARATYLASTEAISDNEPDATATNDMGDFQNDALSISSSSRTLNDMAYELTSRRQFVQHGLNVARRALALARCLEDQAEPTVVLQPNALAEIYKWLAVMIGLACEFVGMRQQILYGVEFKDLIDKAIEHNPNDDHSHHLRGRWSYQVYNLTWLERTMASRLFATPPTATLEEAIEDFEKTEEIRPNFYAANLLYLAKCFISKADYPSAAAWLRKAKDLVERHRFPSPHLDNIEVQNDIQTLYSRYSSYL